MKTIRKIAAGPDFEINLAQMADAEITQNIPSLANYKIGFQIIDKNDDGTRGVGVMIYKMNRQWIYVPVFFLNGRLRGYIEMYMPDRRQFVPTRENWISYISSRQASAIGTPAERLNTTRGARPANVSLLNRGTMGMTIAKMSSVLDQAALEDMCMVKPIEHDMFDLKKWLPRFGKRAALTMLATLNADSDFANAILAFYSPADIEGMTKRAADNEDKATFPDMQEADNRRELQVLTPGSTEAVDLSDKQKEILMRDGVYVVDSRRDFTTVFRSKSVPGNLSTPTTTGAYDIMMSDGAYNTFMVVRPDYGSMGNPTVMGSKDGTTVARDRSLYGINTSKGDTYALSLPLGVLAKTADKPVDIAGLGISYGTFADMSDKSGLWLIMDSKGGTARVRLQHSTATPMVGRKLLMNTYDYKEGNVDNVDFSANKGGGIFRAGRTLYVPEDARLVQIKDRMDCGDGSSMAAGRYTFGDMNTIIMGLNKTAGLRDVKIYSDGISYSISGDRGEQRGLNKIAALTALLKTYGMDAGTAKDILATAGKGTPGRPASDRYMVKYAADADMPNDTHIEGPVAYSDTIPYEEEEMFQPQVLADTKAITQASAAGVKDVMDVAALKALALSGNPIMMVSDWIPDLMLGLDRLGRTLFMFYWHNDQFRETYGNDKMTELEDSLRNEFQNLGELILFLHGNKLDPAGDLFAGELAGEIG